MARTKVNDGAQMPMEGFSRTIDDLPQVEEAIELYMQHREANKEFREAQRTVYELLNNLEIKPGETIRIGRFSVEGVERRGGGFTVPAWTATGIGKISALD